MPPSGQVARAKESRVTSHAFAARLKSMQPPDTKEQGVIYSQISTQNWNRPR
jgi:hypothetical protein